MCNALMQNVSLKYLAMHELVSSIQIVIVLSRDFETG